MTCILNGTAASNRAINTRERLADLFAEYDVEFSILIAGNGRELAPLARRATEEHGGIVECESAPQKTLFRILLPKA